LSGQSAIQLDRAAMFSRSTTFPTFDAPLTNLH
jgi:hypothetical protein